MIKRVSALLMGVLLCGGWGVFAQDAQHLSVPIPGGIPGLPTITGITQLTNGVKVTWDGPSGYYQLYEKPMATPNAPWQPIGTPYNLLRYETLTNLTTNFLFRVAGTTSPYVGIQECAECHQGTFDTVTHTAHARAFTNALFATLGGQTNSDCLVCHTVGFGTPTGFAGQGATPQLASVQCENCHGPAANHASNPGDSTAVPRVEVAGTMCGGCHTTNVVPAAVLSLHPPFYGEWNGSPHQAVVPDVAEDFISNPTVYIPNCGRCHSGTVREAFLEDYAVLPDGQDAGAVGVACATCHDPHERFVYSNVLAGMVFTRPAAGDVWTNTAPTNYVSQTRNPLSSVQDYHTTGDWTTNYDSNINLCGQCHNDRGASYLDTSRAPHHSPQYNILLGTSGVLNTNNPSAAHFNPSTHAILTTNQCVDCHMQATSSQVPTQPGTAGHTFAVTGFRACVGAPCHPSEAVASAYPVVQVGVSNRIQQVVGLLNNWALTKATGGLTNYGTLAWEYTNPGDLSPAGNGPPAALQSQIPVNIKIARYNVYLVYYDGSFGIHNYVYALDLLDTAANSVQAVSGK